MSSMNLHYFIIISLCEKGFLPSFEETLIPYTQEIFVPSFVEIGPVVLEKMKSKKFTDRRADGRRTTGFQLR